MSNIFDYLNCKKKPWKFLAPMVANSEEAYRTLARRYGADLCYTEMVHCKNFNQGKWSPTNNFWYTTSPKDRPLVIQICGNDPEEMLKTCLKVQDNCDAIDINFGCPQEIAKKGHYGSFLQDEWDLVDRIVRTLSQNLKIPLFCKIRIFESIDKSVEYARLIERAGCTLLVVHGRRRDQKGENTGLASWDHIKAIKDSLKIPIISNGNMIYHEDIKRCIEYTKCDGVMIAEPHLYNPTIFEPNLHKSTNIFREYIQIVKENPQSAQKNHIKSHAFKIMRVLLDRHPTLNEELNNCQTLDDYCKFLDKIDDNKLYENSLSMKPYIRKRKIDPIKTTTEV